MSGGNSSVLLRRGRQGWEYRPGPYQGKPSITGKKVWIYPVSNGSLWLHKYLPIYKQKVSTTLVFKYFLTLINILRIHFFNQPFFDFPKIYYILMMNLSLQLMNTTTLQFSIHTIFWWPYLFKWNKSKVNTLWKIHFNPKVWSLVFRQLFTMVFTIDFTVITVNREITIYRELTMYIELSIVAYFQHTNHNCRKG